MFLVFATFLGDAPDPGLDEPEIQRLVHAARTGSASAWRQLYTQHIRRVYRTVRPLCTTDADAEDVAQETFVKLFATLSRYEQQSGKRFVTWLLTVAANVARQRSRSVRQAKRAVELSPPDDTAEPEDLRERRNALLEALSGLPERDRAVLSLRYGGELSAPEVASALGLSPANIRKICERRRAELLLRLTPLEPTTASQESRT